jgi:hypothetical protein
VTTENADNRTSNKLWKLYEMKDRGLVLAKDFMQISNSRGARIIAVGIRSDGVYVFKKPLRQVTPPTLSDVFIIFRPKDVVQRNLGRIVSDRDTAEICAAYKFNSRELLNVVRR